MVEAPSSPVVVKVGGSLYDLPDLGPRLESWLDENATTQTLLVPGGGPTTEIIREWDRRHLMGEDSAHWLALAALTFNARLLAHLLRTRKPDIVSRAQEIWQGNFAVIDAHGFCLEDEARAGHLPHCWDATSDSVAARVAVISRATRLVLLKSVAIPPDINWEQAQRRGLVDPLFECTLRRAVQPLRVQAINFREWQPRKECTKSANSRTR